MDSVSSLSNTLSLHDALPICSNTPTLSTDPRGRLQLHDHQSRVASQHVERGGYLSMPVERGKPKRDRKSTRLNSSHRCTSYAVFCLKKKNEIWNTAKYAQFII